MIQPQSTISTILYLCQSSITDIAMIQISIPCLIQDSKQLFLVRHLHNYLFLTCFHPFEKGDLIQLTIIDPSLHLLVGFEGCMANLSSNFTQPHLQIHSDQEYHLILFLDILIILLILLNHHFLLFLNNLGITFIQFRNNIFNDLILHLKHKLSLINQSLLEPNLHQFFFYWIVRYLILFCFLLYFLCLFWILFWLLLVILYLLVDCCLVLLGLLGFLLLHDQILQIANQYNNINIISMLGSLSEFMTGIKQIENIRYEVQDLEFVSRAASLDDKKHKILVYRTQNKQDIMKPHKKKKQIHYKPTYDVLAWINKQPERVTPSRHWIEHKNALPSQQNLKAKHKLLKAVIKTKQMESQRNPQTFFQKSFNRISQKFSKIKTHPSYTMFIDPLKSTPNLFLDEVIPEKRGCSCPLQPQQILQYQKSVKWAKKHRKNYTSFYKKLGKSIDLVKQEGQGKNNYELQRKHETQKGQFYRKKNRREFLDKIQKRLAQHSQPQFQ